MSLIDDLKAVADKIGPKTIETPDIKVTEHDLATLERLQQKAKNTSPMFHTFAASIAVPKGHCCIHRPTNDYPDDSCCNNY
jgi:hypothetical protein